MNIPAQLARRYRDLRKIGEGGMGEVWCGTDPMLEREVAIKLLRAELAAQPDFVERFRVEAISMARLNHPHIVAVYEFVQEPGLSWMVLEYVRGETLEQLLHRRGRLPWPDAVALMRQALRGVERAHVAGIVHRDIKPANAIVAEDGTLKLMDFGIARIAQGGPRLTRVGHAVGTAEYMSPEQVRGEEADARSDLYALGIVFHELLCGRPPFSGASDFDVIRQQVDAPAPPPSLQVPGLPKAVDRLLAKALAKAPAQRYATAHEFLQALDTLPVPATAPVAPQAGRGLPWGWIGGGATAVALGAAAVLLVPRAPAPEASAAPAAVAAASAAEPAASAAADNGTEPSPSEQAPAEGLAITQCTDLMAQARAALAAGRTAEALRLARQAQQAFSECEGAAALVADAGQRPRGTAATVPPPAAPVARPAAVPVERTAAPSGCGALVAKGWQALNQMDFTVAQRFGEQALAADPGCSDARTLLTNVAMARG